MHIRVSRGQWLLGPGVALLAWAVHFAGLYALASFACGRAAFGWLVTAACGAAALSVLLAARRAPGDTCERLGPALSAITALLALIAIGWQALATLSAPPCR